MKTIRKMMALALAMVMVLAMSVTVFATDAGKGKITVTSTSKNANDEDTTYEAYRIFDVAGSQNADGSYAVDEDGNYVGVTYTIATKWADFFAEGGAGESYIVDSNTGHPDYPQIIVNNETKYIAIDGEDNAAVVNAFAKAAYEYSQSAPIAPDDTKTGGDEDVVFDNIPLGYYMIYPKGASIDSEGYTTIVSLTTTNPIQEVVQKAEFPDIEKEDDDASVELGQVVNYDVTGEVPNTSGFQTYDYTVTDTLTPGLTLDTSDIKVYIGDSTTALANTYVTLDTTAVVATGGGTFKVTIDVKKLVEDEKANVGDAITIKYHATVNSNAIATVSKNHATLTYSRDPKDSTKKTTTPAKEQTVFSSKINVLKVDGTDTSKKLKGAKFVLKCKELTGTSTTTYEPADDGTFYKMKDGSFTETAPTAETEGDYESTLIKYKAVSGVEAPTGEKFTATVGNYYKVANNVVTWVAESDISSASTITGATIKESDDNGELSFEGLENGVYELYEVEAPSGYNKKDGVLATITVNGNDDTTYTDLVYDQTVENNAGSVLPSTGGIGTTIFYIVGAILVLGAGILLVTRRRMNAN